MAEAVDRDTAASVLFGAARVLVVLYAAAACVMAACGLAYVGMLKAVLLLTAAFALVGAGFGLSRGVRGGGADRSGGP
jgi:hypothetical protein